MNRTVRLRTHPITGSARVLWAEEGEPLSEAAALPPLAAARRFVEENASLLGVTTEAAQGLVRVGEDTVGGGRLRRVLFEQVVDGIPVFQGVVSVQVDRTGAS